MLRSALIFFSIFVIVTYCDDPPLSSPPADGQTSPSPTADGVLSTTPAIAVDPGHPTDGNPTGEVKGKGKDGGKGNPRNKHVESLANTIAKFQASQNGGSSA